MRDVLSFSSPTVAINSSSLLSSWAYFPAKWCCWLLASSLTVSHTVSTEAITTDAFRSVDSSSMCALTFFYATADEADAYIGPICFTDVFLFFLFFSVRKKYETTVFGNAAERIFMKLLPNDTRENGVCNVVPPPGEWRMLMICVIYAMTLAESPKGATHGGCVIKSWAREWI